MAEVPINGLLTPQTPPSTISGLMSAPVTANQPVPQSKSILGSMGLDLAAPENLVSLAFLNNAFTMSPDTTFRGVPEAAQATQIGIVRRQEAQAAEEERQRQVEESNKTAEWVKTNFPQYANLPPAQGFQLAMADLQASRKSIDPTAAMQEYQYAVGQGYEGTFAEWKAGGAGGGGSRVSLAGQWGRDSQGNPVYLQPTDTGTMIQAQTPEGVTLVSPFELSADRSAGSAFGKQVGGAQYDLPNARYTADQTIQAINDVRAQKAGMDEHFGSFMGAPQQWLPVLPKSERANFLVEADRAINRAFMEGRQMLKGGGQITDFESRKAEAAITDAQKALEIGDQAMFLKSLDDFEQAVREGLRKLESQASTVPGYGERGGGSMPTPGGQTSGGVQWSLEE